MRARARVLKLRRTVPKAHTRRPFSLSQHSARSAIAAVPPHRSALRIDGITLLGEGTSGQVIPAKACCRALPAAGSLRALPPRASANAGVCRGPCEESHFFSVPAAPATTRVQAFLVENDNDGRKYAVKSITLDGTEAEREAKALIAARGAASASKEEERLEGCLMCSFV